jgi:stage II sporulation protein R
MVRKVLCGVAALVILGMPLARAEYHEDLVRLHVVADSDSEADQAFKLRVRNGVLLYAQELLKNCASADEAYELICENADGFQKAAQAVADGEGNTAQIHVETGVFAFPDRDYDGALVPAGDYRALRVVIGSGEGHNWWCVLYPTLCVPDAASEDVVYYSAVVEWLMNTFGGDVQ